MRINQEENDTTSLHERSEQAVSSSPGQESSEAAPTESKERRREEKPSETGEGERSVEEGAEQDTLGDLEQSMCAWEQERNTLLFCLLFD